MSQSRRATKARATALLGVGTLFVGGGLTGLAPGGATASSHREAPAISAEPQYDNTDVYAFNSEDGMVNLIANWNPISEPAGGPNFHPWATDAKFKINIDNDYDAKPDVVYEWKFKNSREPKPSDSFTGNGTFLYNNGPVTSLKDKNLLFRQTYTLTRVKPRKGKDNRRVLLRNAPVAPSFVGDASMPNYNALRDAAIKSFQGSGRKSFAGQAEDPFFLDLRVFDLIYGGDCASEAGNDTLAGFNVNSVALQVQRRDLIKNGRAVVGIWSTTDRKNSNGKYKQVSRLGQPLVNEVVIPYKVKDTFNSLKPRQDAAALPFIRQSELAATINAVCGTDLPVNERADLVKLFLKGVTGVNNPRGKERPAEYLRLNTEWQNGQTFNRLGVIGGDANGYPNGRRLQDDVVDISLQVVGGELMGKPNDLSDGVNQNDTEFGSNFPFLALPHSGSINKDAPPAQTGSALLTGGGNSNGPSGGFPAGEVSLIGLGALALVAGAVLGRKSRTNAPVTA